MLPGEECILTRDSCSYSRPVLVGMHMFRAYLPYFGIVLCMEHTHKVGWTSVDDCV